MNLLKDISPMSGALIYAAIFSSQQSRPVAAGSQSCKVAVDARKAAA
jgi:hypothetical protein